MTGLVLWARSWPALVLVVAGPSCTGRGTQARLADLDAETAALRERVAKLEADAAHPLEDPVPPTRPSPLRESVPDAEEDPLTGQVHEVRGQVQRATRRIDGVDGDLAALAAHVGGHMDRIDVLRADVDLLGRVADDHADVLDALVQDVSALLEETRRLRELRRFIAIEDGAVVVTDADLVLRQGRDEDGLLKGNGNLYTMVAEP